VSNEGLLDEPAYTVSFMHYEAFVIFLSYGGEGDGGNSKFVEIRKNSRSEWGLSHGWEIENIPLFR